MIRGLPRPAPIGRRSVLLAIAAVLAAAAAFTALAPVDGHATALPPALSQRLGPRTYGLAIPVAWLAAPIPSVREDDVLDLLGARTGERAMATDVARGLRVMSADDRVLIVELTADDASAIATARARGIALVPVLRSAK